MKSGPSEATGAVLATGLDQLGLERPNGKGGEGHGGGFRSKKVSVAETGERPNARIGEGGTPTPT